MPSIDQLKHALQISEQILKLETDLKSVLSGGTLAQGFETSNGKQASAEAKPRKKKSGMSAAGRARIAAAQKARWAKSKTEVATTEAKAAPKAAKPGKKKRTMSPEARARIVAAQKKRWAKFKKAKK
jgi:hypothetical protein